MRAAIKYCGSCNPHLDTEMLGVRITAWLEQEGSALVRPADGPLDLLVILNGCERACADRPEVRGRAAQVLVIAGPEARRWNPPEKGQRSDR